MVDEIEPLVDGLEQVAPEKGAGIDRTDGVEIVAVTDQFDVRALLGEVGERGAGEAAMGVVGDLPDDVDSRLVVTDADRRLDLRGR